MDVLEAMHTRRSVRSFLPKKIEDDKLGVLLDAARLAPSAGNLQNWKFIVVKEESTRRDLAAASFQQFWMQDAALHLVVCAEPEKGARFYGVRGERLYSVQNCGAAIQNILLAAQSIGLGACWVGAFDEEAVRRAVKIPDKIRPQAILAIGYTTEKPNTPPKLKISDISFLEGWGNKIRDMGMALREWSEAKNVLSVKRNLELGKKTLDKQAPDVFEKIREKTNSIVKQVSERVKDQKKR